jgi:hypothetical protein
MEAIKVLINTLMSNNLAKIPTLTDPEVAGEDEKELYNRFFLALLEEKITTNADAAKFLDLKPDSTAYLEFIEEFITRLYHAILFSDINLPEFDDPERAIYLCWQRLSVLRYLLSLGANSAVMQIGRMLLDMAEQFELVPVVIETAMHLRQYHALHKGDRKKYDDLCRLIDRFDRLGNAESLAQDCLEAFTMDTQQHSYDAAELLHKIETQLQELYPYAQEQQTVQFWYAYYLFQIQKSGLREQWLESLEASNEALTKIKVKKATSSEHLIPFLFNQALSLANLAQLKPAIEAIQATIAHEIEGSSNWFRLQEFRITLLLHDGAYAIAWKALKIIWKNQKLHVQSPRQQNILIAIRLWLAVLPDLDQITLSPREKGEFAAFKNTWMERMPNFDAPKPMQELVLLLVQLALYLKQKNQRLIQRCQESLTGLKRYFPLDTPDYSRFNCFLQLLILLEKNAWKSAVFGEPEDQILAELQQLPKKFSIPTMDLEIIPFEQQWEWIKEFTQ